MNYICVLLNRSRVGSYTASSPASSVCHHRAILYISEREVLLDLEPKTLANSYLPLPKLKLRPGPSMAPRLLLLLPLLTMVLMAVASPQAAAASANSDSDLKNPLKLQARARSLLEAPRLDCPKVCYGRCSNNWKNEMCNDKCNVCCKRCNCVPPGTGQDTRHICPCYDTMTNPHNGKLKCP